MGAHYSIELISIEIYVPQFFGHTKIFLGSVISNADAENPVERKTTKYDGPVSRKYSNKIYIDSWAAATSPSFLVKCVAFKGQLISEWIFNVLNFPKKQRKNLMNFCPRI